MKGSVLECLTVAESGAKPGGSGEVTISMVEKECLQSWPKREGEFGGGEEEVQSFWV